jgi:GTPase
MYHVFSIVGRPNVGKSTFFNRLVGIRNAIVDKITGVTRDRNYGYSEWLGEKFIIIDTGGYIVHVRSQIEKKVCEQIFIAIEESDAILFMVDAHTGPINDDFQISKILNKFNKKYY